MSTRTIQTLAVMATFALLAAIPPVQAGSLVEFDSVARPIPRAGGSIYADPPPPEPKLLELHSLVSVVVLESSTATSEAEFESERETDVNMKVSSLIDFNGDKLNKSGANPVLKGKADWDNDNSGSTGRLHRIQTRLKAEVIEILPNKTMLIEGKKEVTINGERQTVTVTGKIQPRDIRRDGSVVSNDIADFNISYTGIGTVTDAQKPGFLTAILYFLWPF